jgi:N-methylhydantoinase B
MNRIDPVTLGVIWGGFVSIAAEMGATLRRTAFSEVVREGMDFSPGLFDGKGRLIAQGDYSPGHLGSMPYAVRSVLQYFPKETLKPGDVLLMNDLYMGSGHLPDFFMFTPVFYKDQIVGYTVNCCHQQDIGGAGAGSTVVTNVSECFQEGIRILPIKLYKEGKPNEDVFRIIEANVRVPEKVVGDMKAQVNANFVGGMRILEMLENYGLEELNNYIDEILDRSEAAMRESIRNIPDGDYPFQDYLDDCGEGTEPILFNVTVRIKESEAIIDFAGSSPQTESGLNSMLNYTRAYAYFALKCLTEPFIPQNGGCMRPVQVTAPEGSFFNPKFPAAGGGRAMVSHRIFEVVIGALAPVLKDRVIAGHSQGVTPCFGGIHPGTGKHFVCVDLIKGSFGARPFKDGADALVCSMNPRNVPVEAHEQKFPILVECLEFIPDSGGAGKFRGGIGVRKDIRTLSKMKLFNLTDRVRFAPYGLFGGKPGAKGATLLKRGSKAIPLHSKGTYNLEPDDLVSFIVSGAGGYGNPIERDVQMVVKDVVGEYVSVEGARKDYGVVIDPKTITINHEETKKLRQTLEERNGR